MNDQPQSTDTGFLTRLWDWATGKDRVVRDLAGQLAEARRRAEEVDRRLMDLETRLEQAGERGQRLRTLAGLPGPSWLRGSRRSPRSENRVERLNQSARELDTCLQDLETALGRKGWIQPSPPPTSGAKRRGLRRVVLAAALTGLAYFGWLILTLPDLVQLEKLANNLTIKVEKQGDELRFREVISNLQISFEDMPKHLVDALLTREDRRFYDHWGVDIIGLGRAVVHHLTGTGRSGGSTLTQQLAKNILFSPERSLHRKFKELALAVKLELTFSKDKLLEMYLNRIYFGRGTNGVETAARKYFRKRAKDLNIMEAAILVGSIPAPEARNYLRHKETALRHARSVLNDMQARGVLPTPPDRVPGVRMGSRRLRTVDHMAILDALRGEIRAHAADRDGLLTVVSSIDPELQVYAELAVKRNLGRVGPRLDATEAALVALGPDGAVRAMVGSADRARSTLNHAMDTRRQLGSVFKPIVYLAALENGWTPDSAISGLPVTIDGYAPRNADGEYPAHLTLRDALADSVNTAAVRLQESVGRPWVINTARRLGLHSELPDQPGLALGTCEGSLLDITAVYGVFANGGHTMKPYLLTGIRDKLGTILYWRDPPSAPQVVQSVHLAQLNDLLTAVVDRGTGQAVKAPLGHYRVAGKTGTTQQHRDAWFVGFSAHLTAGVWVGNDDNQPMRGVTGGGLPATIWADFMRNSHFGTRLPARPLAGLGP